MQKGVRTVNTLHRPDRQPNLRSGPHGSGAALAGITGWPSDVGGHCQLGIRLGRSRATRLVTSLARQCATLPCPLQIGT